jgi:hypothetical protein
MNMKFISLVRQEFYDIFTRASHWWKYQKSCLTRKIIPYSSKSIEYPFCITYKDVAISHCNHIAFTNSSHTWQAEDRHIRDHTNTRMLGL